MALNKAGLISALEAAMTNTISGGPTAEQEANISSLASDFADAIDAFVKSGQVDPGIAVQVTPATGTGATTGAGSIS